MEFENASQRCSWVQVYDEGVKAVLVEDSIVWASCNDGTRTTGAPASATAWPALVSVGKSWTEESGKALWVTHTT